jgi:uncharacterized protein (DUF885 family)
VNTSDEVNEILSRVWAEIQRSPFVQLQLGTVPDSLPDISYANAVRRSALGQEIVERIDAMAKADLKAEEQLTLRLARFRASTWAKEKEWYWLVTDPLGIGLFGIFLPAPYCGGHFLNHVHKLLGSFELGESGAADHYLRLTNQYVGVIHAFATRTLEQAARGVYMPRPQIPGTLRLIERLKAGASSIIEPATDRLPATAKRKLIADLRDLAKTKIEPAFDRLVGVFSSEYVENAPEEIGMHQYDGGASVYEELVKLHTTMDVTPGSLHETGLRQISVLGGRMHDVRQSLGFTGTSEAFLSFLAGRPGKWNVSDAEQVANYFHEAAHRIQPHIERYVGKSPTSSFAARELATPLQATMTFGFYSPPAASGEPGTYYFNTANLTAKPAISIPALTYHELIPGHHFHLAKQQESQHLHPLHVHSFVTVFNEGWAEYAATFAGELGHYESDEETYGRLIMEELHVARLVVDTGLNALGWSLQEARDFLRSHSGLASAEIDSELLRYGADIPGQALAYKVGDSFIIELRQCLQEELGDEFDILKFHEALLSVGGLPLNDLQWNVERTMRPLQ